MTPAQEAAMRQALEALEAVQPQNMGPLIHPAKQALRTALAEPQEPVQEPVAGAVLGPLPEPAQPAQSAGYMTGCPIEIPETPDYYTAEQMREYAMQALAEPVQEPPYPGWKMGCQVCGAHGAMGYVCPRMDCPTRVTCGGAV